MTKQLLFDSKNLYNELLVDQIVPIEYDQITSFQSQVAQEFFKQETVEEPQEINEVQVEFNSNKRPSLIERLDLQIHYSPQSNLETSLSRDYSILPTNQNPRYAYQARSFNYQTPQTSPAIHIKNYSKYIN